jgi:hypothetical protein
MTLTTANKHIMFSRCAHWDAYSLARLILRKNSQQASAPYVKRYKPQEVLR